MTDPRQWNRSARGEVEHAMAAPMVETPHRALSALTWALFLATAAISVLTMPITAIWFAGLAWLVAMASCVAALVPRSDVLRTRMALTGFAVAGGIFVGPAIYLGLAVLRSVV
jgi:hypothetical protein